MTIDELKALWAKDCEIDMIELDKAAIHCSLLHSKYLNYTIDSKLGLAKLQLDIASLEATKSKYFRGEMTTAELRERGWEQWMYRSLKSDIPALIQADEDMQKLVRREQYLKAMIYFLESVLGEIKNRNFAIRAAIDFAKMRAGN